MLIVVSPAKNLDYESSQPPHRATQPKLLEHSEQLIQRLRKLAPQELSALMKISDKLGQLNYDRFQSWSQPFDKSNARAAVLAFNGDVYQGLDASTFSPDDFKFAQEHLRILSGLYGVLRPLDLMQAYRLEMGTKFENDRGKDLYAFWQNIIVKELNAQLKKTQSEYLINLASNEYFKAINTKVLNAQIIEPVFKDYKNGQYKIISFFAKKARGLMAAYIIKNKLTTVTPLKKFKVSGYQYSKDESSPQKMVFLRRDND